MLSDNDYPTYAVTKRKMEEAGIKKRKQVRIGEETGCVVLELGYFIDYENKSVEDPLSVALSLTETEKQDAAGQLERLEEHIIGFEEFPEKFRLYEKEPWYSIIQLEVM